MATVPRRQRYYEGATTSCSACPSAYGFASRVHGFLLLCVRSRAPGDLQADHRAGVFVGHAGRPLPAISLMGKNRTSQVPWRPFPWLCVFPRPRTTPLHLACRGASGAAPRPNTPRASSVSMISRLTEPLHHTLSTLHDGRCRTPCKTRFRLAGCAFAGRESNPLGRNERFQFMSSPFPGLTLSLAGPTAADASTSLRTLPPARDGASARRRSRRWRWRL